MDAKDVALYLKENPDFFGDYADFLAEIFVPHPHGGHAIPIAERQIVTLREKNSELESRLQELIRFGAENDLISTAVFYAQQASSQVASAFLTEFERVITLLVWNPQLGNSVAEGIRVYPFHRFPYFVVYRDAEIGPRIYAIAHQKREPGYWRNRL